MLENPALVRTMPFRNCSCNFRRRRPGNSLPGADSTVLPATRAFFHVDGTYFWRVASPEELVASEADGLLATEFRGRRLKARDSAVAIEAIRQRRTVYVSDPVPSRYPMAGEFHAKSLMAAPLVVANEVIGAAVFLSASEPDFFHDDLAAKATILAGQLGSLLEANRLTQLSREEHRRAEILTEVAQAVHADAGLFDGSRGGSRSSAGSTAHPAGLHSLAGGNDRAAARRGGGISATGGFGARSL